MATGRRGHASLQKILDGVRGNGVLLEEMRTQNRAAIEAVEANRVALEDKIDALARETGGRLAILETAVRQNSADIRQNSEEIRRNSEDIRMVSARVDALGSLARRVAQLD